MKKLFTPTLAVTVLLVLLTALSYLNLFSFAVKLIFFASPFLMVWMVIKILKQENPSKHTFDERFYEDSIHKPVYEKNIQNP
jgi:hypothetical protein